MAGVYATRQARSLAPATSLELILEAVRGAVADAGLELGDVDGVAVDWPGPGGLVGDCASWAPVIGHELAWVGSAQLDNAGARGVLKAAAAIQAGLCDVAVVGGGQSGAYTSNVDPGAVTEFVTWTGASVMAQFALVAQRHMHEFGTTPEQLATVAATIRNNGSVNPEAIMFERGPYGVRDVLASRFVAEPLHLLDCCLVGEGAAAVVLVAADRRPDLRQPAVELLGGGMGFGDGGYVAPPSLTKARAVGTSAARRMFGLAGVRPSDVDVFCLYDATSFEVIHHLETLGVCEFGEGGPFVESGAIGRDGSAPVNPDGGCLAFAWNGTQQMTLKVIECIRQLRGTAVNPVDRDVDVAVATNAGSGANHIEMAVFGK
ncbi:thiolase family protein [Pseudonocardia sp.]|uniref:thiolase family protein n=2 Tax=Pseudonocardia sp. TaxID=60912 RepID=UPI003D097A42